MSFQDPSFHQWMKGNLDANMHTPYKGVSIIPGNNGPQVPCVEKDSACRNLSTTFDEEEFNLLEVFEMLYMMAKEAESFIEACCEAAWIQAAVKLTDMSEHVSAVGFNLELCAIVFDPDSRKWEASEPSLIFLELVDQMNKDEVDTVRKRASQDKKALMERVEALSQSIKARPEDRELASRLLKRLQLKINTALPRSYAGEFYERDISSVITKGKLGNGAYGTVHKAMWLGTEVAKKTIIGRAIQLWTGKCRS